MKSEHKGIKRIIWQVVIIALVLAGAAGFFIQKAFAVFSEKNAMQYKEYAASHTVEDSVLFIGTYLININSMTDELYEKAVQSGTESNQNSMYYKSELAGGAWFDITNAEGLTDIMDSGTAVSEDEVGVLYVRYYVDSSGTMTDVMTGKAVNPFDTPDPYDLSKLPELSNLWQQYTGSDNAESISEEEYLKLKNSKNAGTLRSDVYNYQLLTTFFGLDLSDEETDKLDADLARLFACYQTLKAEEKDEEAEIIYSLMDKVDKERRAIVLDKLSGGDANALGLLYELAGGKYYTSFGNFLDSDSAEEEEQDEDSSVWQEPEYMTELRDAVSHDFTSSVSSRLLSLLSISRGSGDDWWQPLQKNYDLYADKYEEDEDGDATDDGVPRPAFSEDTSLTDAMTGCIESCHTSYNTCVSAALSDNDSILGHAEYEYSKQVIEEADASGAGGPLILLRDILNIKENRIKNSESEKDLLDSSLLGLAEGRFMTAISSGAGSDYQSSLNSGSGDSAAQDMLDTLYAEAESKRSELEYFIDAYRQRETAAKALAYVQGAIKWTKGLYSSVKGDEFQGKASGSIDNHVKWLTDLEKQIKDSDESLKSKLDELNDKKEELQRKRDAALDDNDLAGARDYDAQIAAVDQDIAEEEARSGQTLGDSLAGDILNDALSKLADDPEADISGNLDALAGMGAVDALQTIKDRAGDAGSSQDLLNSIDDSLSEGVDTMASESGSTSDSVGKSAIDSLNDIKEQAEQDSALGDFKDAVSFSVNKLGSENILDPATILTAGDKLDLVGTVKDRAEKAGLSDSILADLNALLNSTAGVNGPPAASTVIASELKRIEAKAGADGASGGASKELLDKIDSALSDMKDMSSSKGSSDSDSLSGMSESEILSGLEDMLGTSLEDASDQDLACAAAAVSLLARSGNSSAGSLSSKLAELMRSKNNKYLFSQYKEKTPKYISLRTIGLVTSYRYVYDDQKNTATMSKGTSAYIFKNGSDTVKRGENRVDTLAHKVVKIKDPYISEEDGNLYFEVSVEYLYGSEYALCLTKTMEEKAKEILESFEKD